MKPRIVKMLDPVEVELREQEFLSDVGESESSDSDNDQNYVHFTFKNRLFGRQKPLHLLFGSRTFANIILWRNKDMSACILAGATVLWLLFEWIGYNLVTLVSHSLLLSLASLFAWSNLANLASFTNFILPPKFPDIILQRETFVTPALMLRNDCHQAQRIIGRVIFGTDSKRFLVVVVILWVISVVGTWFSFLTFLYMGTVFMLTVPALYEKYEDGVDTFAEKILVEIKNDYKALDEHFIQELLRLISYKKQEESLID